MTATLGDRLGTCEGCMSYEYNYAWGQRGNKRAVQVSWHKIDHDSFTTTVYECINYINNVWLLFFPIHLIVYWFFSN